jgi:5-hydroxyisourate hydrolase-like protein (transthyretin family)
VTGFQSNILVTVRGVATEADSEIQVSVTNPKGFTRKLTTVSTNSDGEFRFRVGGLKWTAGTYKLSVKSGSVKQDLAVFVSSKRVRG